MNYYCHFCDQRCKKRFPEAQHWLCDNCKVFYKEDGSQICFRPNSKTHWYWLTLFLNEKRTEVRVERDPKTLPLEDREVPMSEPRLVVEVPYIVQGITPQNMHDKLKTLLMFS